MKKILIASNKKIERKIKKEIEIVSKNIQYKEAIIEILEINNKIDYILLSEDLIGEIDIKKLINKILKINKSIIIYILVNKKNRFIKYNKEVLINKNIVIIEDENDERMDEIFIKKEDKPFIKNRVISISGTGGVGKSITILRIMRNLKNKKILLIDMDYLNRSIGLILGSDGKKEKNKINKKVDLIVYNPRTNFINNLKEKRENYDYILIDTSSEILLEENKRILETSDIILFLVEPNLLGINKANNILEMYTEKWNIEKNKIKIIFNKYNQYSIKYEIIKKIFSRFNIVGRIYYNKKYDLIINKNNLFYFLEEKKRNLYKRVIKKISKKIFKIKGERILWR